MVRLLLLGLAPGPDGDQVHQPVVRGAQQDAQPPVMDPNLAAVGWLWGTEPTDRALAGWQPRTWLALGGGMVMPHKEMRDVLRYAPCRYGMAWREAVSASLPGPPEPTGTPGR
jgi:hypothetical protein